MFSRLFRGSQKAVGRVPDGSRVYAIGDVHGRADLLTELHKSIQNDAADYDGRRVVVHLGDYVDRGTNPNGVIDLLLGDPLPGFEVINLAGNHEEFLLKFLEDPSIGTPWLANGGDATIYAYGISLPRTGEQDERLRQVQSALRARLPAEHVSFLKGLTPFHIEGDFAFVHAGIRPGTPVDQQATEDLYWIREDFLSSRAEHSHIIVHGHTITRDPEERANRIGIDTGAYFSGKLTALVLDGDERRFLQT